MTKLFRILVMLLALVIGCAGTAFAQGAPGAQEQKKGPVDTARQAYENGALVVSVKAITTVPTADGSPLARNYGYRIGDVVTFEVAFITAPGVAINVDNLVKGKFDPTNGSDYELAAAPQVQQFEQEGRQITLVLVKVRTWVMKPNVPFSSVFLYATEKASDGSSPNWKPAATPEYQVTQSRTATEESKALDEGDTSLKVPPRATLSTPLAYISYFLYGIVLLTLGVLGFRWLFPPRVPAPNQVAWKKLDAILAKSEGGLSYADTMQVAGVLRHYLRVESVSDDDAMQMALATFFEKDAQRYELARVGAEAFAILDKALYEPSADETKVALTPAQTRDLFARIERLVERP